MEFGILFTSHANAAVETYPHRAVHARVTQEVLRADALGSGYCKYEFDGFGVDFEARRDIQEEALPLLMQILRDKRFAHRGTYFRLSVEGEYDLFPHCLQQPHPPIFLADDAGRDYDTLSRDIILHGSPATVAEKIERLRALTGAISIMLHYPPWYGVERSLASLELFAAEVTPRFEQPHAQRVQS